MKKVDLFLLLTSVALAVFASFPIPLLHLSVTSKVIILTLSSFVSSSVALLAILESRGIWPTTNKQAGLNRLHHLKEKEKEIAAGMEKKKTATTDVDWKSQWEELNEREQALYQKRQIK